MAPSQGASTKTKPSQKTVSKEELHRVLEEMLDEGNRALGASAWGFDGHCETITTALLRAVQQDCAEIRLTYKSASEAMAAWTWMLEAARKALIFDENRSSMFDIELKNGSGILFAVEENDGG
jgi:hypothetical protein